ncbi:hypothetical protein ACJMK2_008621 [Sinanodonta woodiana]|uniref:Uncharacterized protein n=1 Tax=Sinanodonta woodiana TaxID=1069815 RepID=A0ABD3VNR8_SINWO
MTDTVAEKTPLLRKPQAASSNGSIQIADDKTKSNDTGKKSASLSDLFRYANCLDVLMMLIGSFFSIVHGAAWPVLFIFFGDMTNDFVKGPSGASYNFTVNQTQDELKAQFEENMTKNVLNYVYIGAAVLVASCFQMSFWSMSCERQVLKIRKNFFMSILRQEIVWFDEQKSGELTNRLADDLERVREGIGDKVSLCIQFVAAFAGGFGIGFWKGWKLTLVMMSLTPVLAICAAFFSKMLVNYTKKEQETYAQAGSVAEEVLSCIRTVMSFNGQKLERKRYETALEESKKLGVKKSLVTGLGTGFTFFVMFATYALAFWFGNTQVKDWYNSGQEDGMSPGSVLTVFFCVIIGSFSIGNASPHLNSIATAKGAAAVLFDIIDNKPKIDSSSKGGQRLNRVQGQIEFHGVSFAYPTRSDVKVLENFSLRVNPGETVALVGHSGCGKSTVVNLLQRFYDPQDGKICLDEVDVKDLNVRWLRQNIGVVSQEPVLFGFTIRENILLGNPTASEDQIVNAAKAANAHDFISQLPEGYDTLVGERGAQLSGGQRQRVAIARAIIRDPKILLLDEATSALDTKSEGIVQAALDKAREGRTTIVIAHRLSTIQNANMIHVLDKGQVVESGTHSELMDRQGAYFQLVTAQQLVEEEEGFEMDEDVDKDATAKPKRRRESSTSSGTIQRQQSNVSRQHSVAATKETPKEGDAEEEEVAEQPGFCRIVKENRTEWPFIFMGCFAAAINGATMPVFAIFFSEMIKVFIELGNNGLFWSMMFLVLGSVNFLTNSIQIYCFGQSGERLTMRLRLQTFTALVRQDVAYFDDKRHSTGALTTRLATDASLVKNATGIRIGTTIQILFGLVTALIISFYFGWKLAFVVLGAVPILAVSSTVQMKALMGKQKQNTEELEKAGKIASESIENIRTVQSLTREVYFYEQYCKYLLKPFRDAMTQSNFYGLAFGFSQSVVFMLYAGCFRFGAYMVSLDEMAPENVYKVFFAISFTGIVIGQASSFLPDYSKARQAAGLIFKTLDTIPIIDIYSARGQRPNEVKGQVEYRNVHFHYPSRLGVEVLRGLSFHVESGQTVALVGPSGCGKSTVISLLQRFYDPNDGEILVDGVNIRELNLKSLRAFISVVSQEPVLFDCSIWENIKYGDDSVSMEDVIDAARIANIHEFITGLPLGYETVVGEKGTQLSGGQKQRVALARALVRNPKVLLLDEATSALDTQSEKLVQDALDNAQKGRTCIVIAHRLSTIQNADVILVIDKGRIIERGNHQQLLAQKGVYATLVASQKFT